MKVRLEPSSDPVWLLRSNTLLKFLHEPRTWAEILQFGQSMQWPETKLRSVLAYAGSSVAFGRRGDGKGLKWWARSTAVAQAAE